MKRIKKILRLDSTRITIAGAVVLFLLSANIVLGYNYLHKNKVILGLKIDQISLNGLAQDQVQATIRSQIKNLQPLRLSYHGKIFEVTARELGAKIDTLDLAKNFLKEGRTGNIWNRFLEQSKAILGRKHYVLDGTLSQTLLTLKILAIKDEINVSPTPITLDFTNDMNKTIPARDGVAVDNTKLSALIVENIFHPPNQPLEIPTVALAANKTHSAAELPPIRAQAIALTKSPVSISYAGQKFTLTPNDLRSMLIVVERPDPTAPGSNMLTLRLNPILLDEKLGKFAIDTEKATHAEFNDHDSAVAIYSQFYSSHRNTVVVPAMTAINQTVLAYSTDTRGPKVAYLTFDDGPNAIYHPFILDILKQYDVKATFFLVGQNVEAYPAVSKRTVAEGHAVGNHSLTHAFLPALSQKEVQNEINLTDKILKSTLNISSIKIFRPPYGGINPEIRALAKNNNLQVYLWDVDPRDWSEPTTDELVNRVINFTHNGSDILLHSNHSSTVKALPRIIERLRAEGYTFGLITQ
jgi:peptidoglycan/xylan/chitin deacetylase (PgdA/CDA1 family)